MNMTFQQKRGLLALILIMLCLSSCAVAQSSEELWAAYQQTAERVAGQAYVEILPFSDPVRYVNSSDPVYPQMWQIGQFYKETNGVPFTAEKTNFVRFDAEHNVIADFVYEGDEILTTGMYGMILDTSDPNMWITTQPVDNTKYYGFAISGVDANGNQLTFRNLVELIDEPYAMELPDTFISEGDELVALHVSEQPVPVTENDFFGGGIGWVYDVTVENISDAPVELTDAAQIFFNGDLTRFQYYLQGQAIADWAYAPSCVLAPGETLVISDMAPVQPLTNIGFRFEVRNESGNAQTACVLVELAQDL